MKRFILTSCMVVALTGGLVTASATPRASSEGSFISTAMVDCPTTCTYCSGGEHFAENWGPFNDRMGNSHVECIPGDCAITHEFCFGAFNSLTAEGRTELWRTLATMDAERIQSAIDKYAFIEYNAKRGLLQLIDCTQQVAANLPVDAEVAAALE